MPDKQNYLPVSQSNKLGSSQLIPAAVRIHFFTFSTFPFFLSSVETSAGLKSKDHLLPLLLLLNKRWIPTVPHRATQNDSRGKKRSTYLGVGGLGLGPAGSDDGDAVLHFLLVEQSGVLFWDPCCEFFLKYPQPTRAGSRSSEGRQPSRQAGVHPTHTHTPVRARTAFTPASCTHVTPAAYRKQSHH